MSTKIDSRQIVNRSALSSLKTSANEEIDNLLAILNSRFITPLRMRMDSVSLYVDASSATRLKSDGADGTEAWTSESIPPIGGIYKTFVSSSINLTTGAVSGDFEAAPFCPTMTASYYIRLGLEARSDGKLYLSWGQEASSLPSATYPSFGSGLPIGIINLQDDGSGGQWNFDTALDSDITQFVGGGGASGGDGSGLGSDLGDLEYRASIEDSFSAQDLIGSTTATVNVGTKLVSFNYDTNGSGGSLSSVAGASTNITWTGTPNFTVAAGDVVIAKIGSNVEARKITSITSQTDVTIEVAFSANLNTATYVCVSQAIHTKDLLNWYDTLDNESLMISEMIGHIALTNVSNGASDSVDHSEQPEWLTPAIDDIVLKGTGEAVITSITDSDTFVLDDTTGFGGDGDARIIRPLGSFALNYLDNGLVGDINVGAQIITGKDLAANWDDELVVTRKQNFQDPLDENVIAGAAGAHLYARFFANKSLGKGSVTLYEYQIFFSKESDQGNGGIINQAYGRLNGSDTPKNCTISVASSKTRITLADDFPSFVSGLNPDLPHGDLIVNIDGGEVPRYLNATTSVGAYYTEDPAGRYIELDSDYSSNNYLITLTRRQGNIDSSSTNSTRISVLESKLSLSKATDYTILDSDMSTYTDIFFTDTSSNRTCTLPTLADNIGKEITIHNISSDKGKVTVDGEGAETINGFSTIDLDCKWSRLTIKATSSGWIVRDHFFTDKQYAISISGTNWTTTRGVGIPHRGLDGIWRFRFNIQGDISSAVTNATISLSGITFKNSAGYQAVTFYQNLSGSTGVSYVSGNLNTINMFSSGNFGSGLGLSGDVELESKPTFIE